MSFTRKTNRTGRNRTRAKEIPRLSIRRSKDTRSAAIAAAGLVAAAAWGPGSLVGTTIAGPPWLRALLPLLIGAPLALRRRAPLLMWTAIWAGITLAYRITGHPLQNLELMVVLAAASYSLGAHATLRRAAAGLAVSAVMILASGAALLAFTRHPGGAVIGVSFIPLLGCWLAGVPVRARRLRHWPNVATRSSARPSRPRPLSASGSPGNCTTSSLITSA
jgi:hypothetical protein